MGFTCCIPGCGRSMTVWNREGRKGRKPYAFKCLTRDSQSPKYRAWQALFHSMSIEFNNLTLYVCDIHFKPNDFFPSYSKKLAQDPNPEHMKYAKLKREAIPSLFLDKNENTFLHKKAKIIGVSDWWRLSQNYDEKLDLDQLVAFNKPVTFCKMNTGGNCEPNAENSINYNQSVNESNMLKSLNKSISVLESIKGEPVDFNVKPNNALLSEGHEEVITSDCYCDLPTSQEMVQSDEVLKKKRLLFRMLCTSPLNLPEHWAFHSYIKENYVTLSKVCFSPSEAFTIDRAIRVTSTMEYPDVYCKGKNISQFMQGQPLNSISDVELLIEKVNMW